MLAEGRHRVLPVLFEVEIEVTFDDTKAFADGDGGDGQTGEDFFDLPEDPGIAESAASDEDAVSAADAQSVDYFLRCMNVAVDEDGNSNSFFDFTDLGPVSCAAVALYFRPAVDGDEIATSGFQRLSEGDTVGFVGPAEANLDRERDIDYLLDGAYDVAGEFGILHEGSTVEVVDYFVNWAAHVEIKAFGVVLKRNGFSGLGQNCWVTAEKLLDEHPFVVVNGGHAEGLVVAADDCFCRHHFAKNNDTYRTVFRSSSCLAVTLDSPPFVSPR